MNKLKFSIILLFSVAVFMTCTGLFSVNRKYKGSGTVKHFVTKMPIKAEIFFSGLDPKSSKEVQSFSKSYDTDNNGCFNFEFKTNARKLNAIVRIGKTSYNIGKGLYAKSHNNWGDVLVGDYTFFCKINLVKTSNSQIFFKKASARNFTLNNDSALLYSNYLNNVDFWSQGSKFIIDYYTISNGVVSELSKTIAIVNGDTLSTIIEY